VTHTAPVVRRTQSHFAGSGGLSLLRRAWLPPRPERVLALVHGYAEHSGRYDRMGVWLAERGCAVHAYDQRGHGRSAGERGHVDRFDDFLDDLDALLARVRAEHPGLPVFVVGHSMGGLVVAAWTVDRAPDVAGVVTSGAALRISETVSPSLRLRLRLARALVPRRAMPRPIDPEALSRDPEVGRAYQADPLVFQQMTLSLAAELFDAARRTAAGAAAVALPVLLLHGEDDPLCPASGSRDFHAGLRAHGSALRLYPGLRHEIFNEPEQEDVFADLLEWVRARERARESAGAGDGAAGALA
jgi:alpha-beta hydrolase superfamily lysophospholipase